MTPWTVALQAPLSIEFSGQEYWSGLPFPSPEDLPGPTIEPGSPALQMDSSPSEPPMFSSVAQLCLTLCDPMNRSTPGLPVHHQPPMYVYIIIFTNVPQGHKILLDLQLSFRKYLNYRCNIIHKHHHWHHCDVN